MSVGDTQVESLFFAALEKTPDERPAFLEEACGANHNLRERVDRLLRAQPHVGRFMATAPLFDLPQLDPNKEQINSMIGPYKLREQLGEGGMGTVYVAEQLQPIRRTVALKLIKPGMDTREVVGRFQAERQALALMDHPFISKVLDVGTTETGRPYFVMELIRGIPISDDCDQYESTTHERLQLFIKVCRGLQHAHEKGIVHRDLKPSNILVTHYDHESIPKIIDFGVAKAINQQLSEHTVYTRFSQVLGTPLYMSPEQAELNAIEVDARSDVYSLGVMLYELLTGNTPFDREILQKGGLDEFRKKVCEEDPVLPSSRLSTLDEVQRSTICARRRTDARRLGSLLRGDLDWIVMKALEKDRSRRYQSAGEMADDLQRFLDDQPVRARRPSLKYRLQKMARRTIRSWSVPGVAIAIMMFTLIAPLAMVGVFTLAKNVDLQWLSAAFPSGTGKRSPAAPDRSSTNVSHSEFPGLVPRPKPHPELGRWQLMTRRPQGVIRSAVWSPDEKRFALCEANHVRIYDAATLQILHVLVGHTLPVRSVEWHPDGERLASGGEDGIVRLWSKDGIPTHSLIPQSEVVYQVAWSPDGQQLAAATADGKVRVWNDDGRFQQTIDDGNRHVFCLAWSPNSRLLATAGGDIEPPGRSPRGDTTIRLWEPRTGKLQSRIGGADKFGVLSLSWHPDGQQIAAGYGDVYRSTQEAFSPLAQAGVKIWSVEGDLINHFENLIGTVNTVAWSPDGAKLAFGGRHGIVRIWEMEQSGFIELRSAHKLDLYSLRWNRNSTRLLSASRESVREWNNGSNATTLLIKGSSENTLKRVKWNPSGTMLCAEGYGDPLFWTSDGTSAAKPQDNHFPEWWEKQTPTVRPDGKQLPRLDGHPPQNMRNWAWNCKGWLAGASWQDASVRIWNEQGQLINNLQQQHRGGVESVSWSPDGESLASGGGDSIRIWRSDGKPGVVMKGHTDEIYPVAWSPDGKWIASGSSDSTVRLWKPDGTPGPVFRGHVGGIHDVAWSPDSTQLASASWLDSTVRVWDLETGQTLWQSMLIEPKGCVTISASGELLNSDNIVLRSEFIYLIETKTYATELIDFEEFQALLRQTSP